MDNDLGCRRYSVGVTKTVGQSRLYGREPKRSSTGITGDPNLLLRGVGAAKAIAIKQAFPERGSFHIRV
jgi:hypothetical protein